MKRSVITLLWILCIVNFLFADVDVSTSNLLSACQSNNLTGVRESLAQGADVNATDQAGSTPLLYAVSVGNPEMTELLLESGARQEVNDSLCRCPVIIAVQRGNVEVLRKLAAFGGNLHHRHLFAHGNAQTPLQVAVQNEDLPTAKYLLSKKVSTEARNMDFETPLMLAAATGNLEMVKLLIENGAYLYADRGFGGSLLDSEIFTSPPAIKRYLQGVEQKHLSAVEEPAWADVLKRDEIGRIKPESMEEYLQQGGDPHGKDKEGRTLLHYAAGARAKKGLLESLLTIPEIDINTVDIHGVSPLHMACRYDEVENVKLLLQYGASVDERDCDEKTPLLTLARFYFNHSNDKGEVQIAQMLLNKGADVNATDAFGRTPLLCLAKANMDKHLGFARLLIEHRADVNRQDCTGKTFLHGASEMGTAAMMQLAIEAGADMNIRDYQGRSILDVARYDKQEKIDLFYQYKKDISIQEAIYFSQAEALDKLVQQGADINMVTEYDNAATGLIIASKKNDPMMVKKLLGLGAAVDTQDTLGNTALHYAAQYGFDDVVAGLLEGNADVTIRNKEGWRALDLAGTNDRYRVIQLFKDKYPDMEVSKQPQVAQQEPEPKPQGEGEMEMEVPEQELSEDEAREQMITAIAAQVNLPLHKAVIQEDRQTIEQILTEGKEDVNGVDNMGSSALMYAVYLGNLDTAKLLIDNGASVGFQNKEGMNALYLAIFSGREDFVEMLLEAGADPSVELQAMGQINALEAAMMTKQEKNIALIRSKAPSLKANPEKFAMTFETPEESALDPNQIEAQMRKEERNWKIEAYLSQTSKRLHRAIIQDKKETVKKLLKEGADVHETDEAGILPLNYAVLMENREMAALLMENGANINRLDSNVHFADIAGAMGLGHSVGSEAGWGAIHYAAVFASQEVLEFLISKGADVDLADIEHGESPIFSAVEVDRPEIVKLLVNAGADLKFRNKQGQTILHSMARRGKIDYIKLLLEIGADIDIGKPGTTPLMVAARSGEDDAMIFLLENGADINILNKNAGNLVSSLLPESYTTETLRILIEYGIDVNAKNSRGQPPLFNLLKYGGKMNAGLRKKIQLLLTAGVDVNATDKKGNSILHHIAKNCCSGDEADSIELTNMMIAHGADTNVTNSDGETALHIMLKHYAKYCGVKELIPLLAENNTHLDDRDRFGCNILHNAAIHGWADAVTLMASKGVSLENRNVDNQRTPLLSAIHEKNVDVVKALLDSGADIEAKDKFQRTPLITVVSRKNVEITQVLLDYQPNCNVKDENGETPLHIAVRKGNEEIIRLLLGAGARTDIPSRSNLTAPELAQRLNKLELLELFDR